MWRSQIEANPGWASAGRTVETTRKPNLGDLLRSEERLNRKDKSKQKDIAKSETKPFDKKAFDRAISKLQTMDEMDDANPVGNSGGIGTANYDPKKLTMTNTVRELEKAKADWENRTDVKFHTLTDYHAIRPLQLESLCLWSPGEDARRLWKK